jgi:hypothetical protein
MAAGKRGGPPKRGSGKAGVQDATPTIYEVNSLHRSQIAKDLCAMQAKQLF